jgi:Ca2+:H+ antiporter
LLCCAGCCFLFGGLFHQTQTFNAVANQATSSMLMLSCLSIVLPTAAMHSGHHISEAALINLSRATAIIMLLV